MNKILDILIPRFITEEVALEYDAQLDKFVPICAMVDIGPYDYVDAKVTFRSFNFFGLALFPSMVEDTLVGISPLGRRRLMKVVE